MVNENQTVQFFHPLGNSILVVSLFRYSILREVNIGYETIGSWIWKSTIPKFKDTTVPMVKLRVTTIAQGTNTLEDKDWETESIPSEANQRMGYWQSWAKTNGFVQTPE